MKPFDPARMHRKPLSRKHSREGSASEIIYGKNSVLEALSSGSRTFFEIIVLSQHADKLTHEAGDTPVRIALREELEKITGSLNHQGIAARVSPYGYAALNDMMDLNTIVLLDSVEDPQNLGSIIRTSHALSGAGVIIPEHRSASVTPAVVKASSGATERIRIARVQNLRESAKQLKKHGFWLVGLDASAKEDLSSIPRFDKVGLILGGEDIGIRPVIEGELDILARIPMKGTFNSLNVAQACAIALYELTARK
jgi:23S rRNA (guanosine2251-2'-O)-methyltransferase